MPKLPGTSRLDAHFRSYRRKGDARALSAVFDLAAPEMLRVARRFARGDECLAEDAVQNAFLVAMQKAEAFDPSRRVLPWLLGILAHELRRERAAAARLPDPVWLQEGVAGRTAESPEAAALNVEFKELVASTVEELPETYRDAVREHLFSSGEASEIAGRLGITSGALHVRVHRGLGLLRGLLPAGVAVATGLVVTEARGLAAVRGAVLGTGSDVAGGAAASAAVSTAAKGGTASVGTWLTAHGALVLASLGGLIAGATAVAVWPEGAATPVPDQHADVQRSGVADPIPTAEPIAELAQVPERRVALDPLLDVVPARVSAPSAPAGDAALKLDDWLALYREADGYTDHYMLGQRLIALPEESGFAIAKAVLPSLSPLQRVQFIKPFLFREGASYGLEIAHEYAVDADPAVRSCAWAGLRPYALRDFAEDPGAYADWRRATEGLSRREVLLDAAAHLAARAEETSLADASSLLNGALVPSVKTLKALGLEPQELFAATEFHTALEAWIASGDRSAALASLEWLHYTAANEASYRTFVLPLLDSDDAELRAAATLALQQCELPFATLELEQR